MFLIIICLFAAANYIIKTYISNELLRHMFGIHTTRTSKNKNIHNIQLNWILYLEHKFTFQKEKENEKKEEWRRK